MDNGVRDKFVDNLNLAFNPGDYISIRCLAGQGGDAINVSLWFRTDGVIGPTGATGMQGPIGAQGVTGPSGASWAVETLNNDIVFKAKLGAVGDVSFNSNLYLHGNGYFNNNLSIGNDLTVNHNLYVLNDTSINKLIVNNDANFNSKLIANRDASFNSKLTVGQNAYLNSKLLVINDVCMNSKLFVSGNTTLNSNLLVANNTILNVGLKVLGDVSFNNELFVDGKALFQDKVIIDSDLYVLNDTSLNSTLYVEKDVSFNSKLSVANDVSLNSKLTVLNDVSLNSRLTVANNATLNSKLFVNGDVSVNANLYVREAAIIEKTLNVNDNTYLNAILMVTDNALLNSKLIVMDNTVLNSKLTVDGDALLDSTLVVINDVSLNSKLFVRGDTTMNSRVDICGNLYAQYPNKSIPKSAINGQVGVPITFGTIIGTDISSSKFTDISAVYFDTDAGFDVTEITNGEIKVSMNSTFKYWDLSGQVPVDASNASITGLVARGLDTMNFVAGDNVQFDLYTTGSANDTTNYFKITALVGGSGLVVNNRNQSFYDIITQQPQPFTKNVSYTDGYSNTTRSITAYWTYDDILAKIPNSAEFAVLNFDTSYKKILPNIDKVYIDVSSGSITNGWARYNTLNITNNYNTTAYKSLTINRKQPAPSGNSAVTTLMATNPIVTFDLRVYGENSGANYPTVDARSLIYRQIAFKEAKAPGQPVFVSTAINSFDQITLTYNFTYPETGDTASLGFLSESQTKYTQSDTLSSTAYPRVQTIATDNETDDNVAGGINFTVVLTGLRAGTKYNFLTRVQNDLSPLYSILDSSWASVPYVEFPYDSNGPTQYTTLPSSGAYTTTGPSTLTYAPTNNITTSTLSNGNVIYVNIGNSDTINPTNSTAQSFQITNPAAASTDVVGYGKWIDDLTNLVQIKAYVDDSQKQVLSYNGFTPSAGTKTGTATIGTSNTGVNYFSTPTQADIYSGNSQTQGFRLYGTAQLLSIATANVQAAIGQARSTPYQLKLEVTRDSAMVGGSATVSATSNIYVDNLSLDPTFTSTNTPTVLSVGWTMGIPSVKKYKIDCARTYNNINSTTGFIRGDRKLSSFTGITTTANNANTTGFTTGTISIAQNAIQGNGTYIYNAAAFSSSTSSALQSLHYTSAILNTSTTLTVSETAYSLKTGDSGLANNTTVTVSHHFDMSSYNNYGDSLSTKLTLTDIYEITDATISKLNSDIGGLGVAAYTDHTVIIKDWTLLYYSGKFQTNSTVTYPNVTSYTWNGLSGSYTYNAGANGLDLTGSQVSSGTRYKWVVFKLNKSSNTQYSFNGTIYNVLSNNENNKYLSVKAMLSDTGLFNSATVSALFNDANADAIGFCRATKVGTSINVIGNLKQIFDPLSGIWSANGTATTGYTNSLSPSYGSKITNSNGDFGIYINPTAINNDLYLFIGLKI
jgi:predicted acyltransferase (DUF342 family)